ncbi:MAG: accessory Sec system translocase SecA2 [Lachnospiraceae bacterium]|nr:accessory Sec system translocase SecA2 [Lachnospiraceae bacterium]
MKRILRKYYKYLKQINRLAVEMETLSDEDLGAMTGKLKSRLQKGETLEDILPEAFAAIREAAGRVLGMYPYDVQILGGLVLHFGNIAEMCTGEGKTLVAVMPLYLNALTGRSTILVTVNDYLAARDGKQMRELFSFMHLTTGIGVEEEGQRLTPAEKRKIYASDIVYTTNSALGFDYLAENLAIDEAGKFLRPYYYVILDEADSVLLDSAQTPLVISGAPRVQSNMYNLADYFVATLRRDIEYEFEEKEKKVWLTEEGIEVAQRYFGVENLYDGDHFELVRHITLALQGHILFERDKQYVVEEDKVKLLDEQAGRIIENTKLRGGQHQALEAKEHVSQSQENRAMASITYQAFFNMFPKIGGMSGTAAENVDEFLDTYHMDVIRIPTRKPIQRKDLGDSVFYNREDQVVEALAQVQKIHATGQPVLLIACSIAVSDACSKILLDCGIPHNVLNAYNIAKEAEIIAEAGQEGAVTVATAIAGRGTDIRLGKGVNELGGLAVIGIGLMDNMRLERQARGRSGRQGDKGFSKFYISLEDEVVKHFAPEKLLEKYSEKSGKIVERRLLRCPRKAQNMSEKSGRDARKNTIKYAESTMIQRNLIYSMRDTILKECTTEPDYYLNMERTLIDEFLDTFEKKPEAGAVIRYVLDNITYDLDEHPSETDLEDYESIKEYVLKIAETQFERQREKMESDRDFRHFLCQMSLRAIDDNWIEQVDYVQQLRIAISGRSMAQRNVMHEFHRESHDAFMRMEKRIKRDMMRNILLGDVGRDAEGKQIVIVP